MPSKPRPRVKPPRTTATRSASDPPVELVEPYLDDLATLALQLAGGVRLLTEVLDDTHPGWDSTRRSPKHEETPAARYAYGQLHTAWINVTSMMKVAGVPTWQIEPMETRSDGEMKSWEWRPDGGLELAEGSEDLVDADSVPAGAVRERSEPHVPRFTLEEAAELLGTSHTHAWSVVLDEDHEPTAVACAFCTERRPIGAVAEPQPAV